MTFTKEQLLNQARENVKALKMAVVQSAFKDIRPAIELDLALAELALAGMEAEPVAYMIGGHYLMHAQDPKVDNYASAVPLYTAPQPLTTSERAELENYRNAQQVVPGAIEPDYEVIKAILPTANPDEYACCIAADMWNACRSAMLQGAAGNHPVIPDGWVMVPVEPTEDMCNVSHIGVDVYTGLARDDEYYSIGGVCAAKVYRAMLAAAPQKE